MIEKLAQRLYFEFMDSHGYPNGMPRWDEMNTANQAVWLCMARAAVSVVQDHLAQTNKRFVQCADCSADIDLTNILDGNGK